jgi:hypothetical protein
MKPHLISTDVLSRQVYRYNLAYRVAGFLLCCFLVAQIPLVAWLFYERGITAQRQQRAAQLVSDTARITSEHKKILVTEQKLKRIQDLAPLLRARLPIGAVLGKIEQLTPPDLTVARITIDAEAYQPLQIESALFHVPGQIRISIEGEQAVVAADPQEYNVLARSLLQSLPPQSKIADSKLAGGFDTKGYKTFSITLIAPANAQYFGLGVVKLAAPNSL